MTTPSNIDTIIAQARATGFRAGVEEAVGRLAECAYIIADDEIYLNQEETTRAIRALLPADATLQVEPLTENEKISFGETYETFLINGRPIGHEIARYFEDHANLQLDRVTRRMRESIAWLRQVIKWQSKTDAPDELAALRAEVERLRNDLEKNRRSTNSYIAAAQRNSDARNVHILKLEGENERLREALTVAENGFDRLHNALMGLGPKQACGEMADYFLTETRAALTQKEAG